MILTDLTAIPIQFLLLTINLGILPLALSQLPIILDVCTMQVRFGIECAAGGHLRSLIGVVL